MVPSSGPLLLAFVPELSPVLWWLHFFVSTWLGHGAAIILGVSGRVFLDEISIWICRLSKADGPPRCGWASSNPSEAWIEQKAKKGRMHSLPGFEWGHWSPALRLECTPSALLVLRPLGLDWTCTLALLGPQLADSRSWDLSVSLVHEPIPYNKS